jgi:pyruvate/2-oxoglutarate dehydrogenase complex dihydrolipoamide acyltransferase (E2) component
MRNHNTRVIIFLLAVNACKQAAPEEEITVRPKVSVSVVEISRGTVKEKLTLMANTLYLKRNVVTAPLPSYVSKVFIRLGDRVKQGQALFQLETKEAKALGSTAKLPESTSASFGKIVVKAPASGIITTLDKQQTGDYILEGGPLCTIAESNTLAFAVNVPFEFRKLSQPGMPCSLILPDNSVHTGRFTTPLSTMNAVSQTQTILAKSAEQLSLPENLIIKVQLNKNNRPPQQVLPKKCVLSDEMLENFWVMELTNDTTAVRVNVTLGNSNPDSTEILSPAFDRGARFLASGNYGLPDTVLVQVHR